MIVILECAARRLEKNSDPIDASEHKEEFARCSKKLGGDTLRQKGYQVTHKDLMFDFGLCLHLMKLFNTQ